jgi:hypothetical protein
MFRQVQVNINASFVAVAVVAGVEEHTQMKLTMPLFAVVAAEQTNLLATMKFPPMIPDSILKKSNHVPNLFVVVLSIFQEVLTILKVNIYR